jgi:hypothetical protein
MKQLLVALIACLLALPASAQAPDEQSISDAYVYLLGRALVIRQERGDLKEPKAAYNRIKYNPRGSADFVNPNFDVAYLEAWFAVDDHSTAILDVPQVQGRYYTVQILDEWGEVIANINERTFPSKPYGKFALVKPGSRAAIPPGAGRIELHSSKAKMLARVELKDSPDEATRLQKAFKVSMSSQPRIAPPPAIPAFDNQDLIGVELFEHAAPILASALDIAPNAAPLQQKVRSVAAYVASGKEARAAVDRQLREKTIPAFKRYATTEAAPYRNHWLGAAPSGNYGADYRLRTMVNLMGIWGNTADEVIYFGAFRDAEERPLDGGKSYLMHFAPDALPDAVVNAYWSVILVGVPDYRVVPNALKRYNFNNHSALQKEADGSLKIGIGPRPVKGVPESNWLPSAEGQPFSLTFRTYVPKEIIRREWAPPPLVEVK